MEKHEITWSDLRKRERKEKRAETCAIYLIMLGAVAGATLVLNFVVV